MKKQLLSIAMLVSVFAVGNVLATGGDEGAKTQQSTNETTASSDNQNQNSGSNNQGQSSWTNKIRAPFDSAWTNAYPLAIGAVVGATTKVLVDNFDKITGKAADVEEEDDEDEEE